MPGFEELVEDTLEKVRSIREWDLDAVAWNGVRDELLDLERAIARRHVAGVRRAWAHIQAQVRGQPYTIDRVHAILRRPGDKAREVPPPAVFDLINRLVHPSEAWAGKADPGLLDAWNAVHAVTPAGWYVGEPSRYRGRGRDEWLLLASDQSERRRGVPPPSCMVFAPTEEGAVRELARCLRELKEGHAST